MIEFILEIVQLLPRRVKPVLLNSDLMFVIFVQIINITLQTLKATIKVGRNQVGLIFNTMKDQHSWHSLIIRIVP